LLLAHDPALRRNLWIHRRAAHAESLSVRRRDLSRATRLRWLNGERDSQTTWDAYEALDGAPLLKLPPQNWAAVRFWLHDLASEIKIGREGDSLPPALELNRVWITADNRAVLLDFPCPSLSEANVPPITSVNHCEDFAAEQTFLNAVAEHGLARAPQRVPLYAMPFLRSLAEGRFESPEFLVGNLQSLLGKKAEVSPRRRFAVMGVALGTALIIALIASAILWFQNKRTTRNWPAQFEGGPELRAELRAYETFRDHSIAKATSPRGTASSEDAEKQFRRAFRFHMAGHHRALIQDSNFWAHPVVDNALSISQKEIAEEAIKDSPTVDPQKLEEADAMIRYLQPAILAADTELAQWIGLGIFWALVFFAALIDLCCAVLLGEGLFMRLLGVATVNRRGEKASRLRVLARTILAWSPYIVGASLSLALWMAWLPGVSGAPALMAALIIFTLLMLAAMAWAVKKPARSLQDIAVGTWLVPR
jgi:hypothetical protein